MTEPLQSAAILETKRGHLYVQRCPAIFVTVAQGMGYAQRVEDWCEIERKWGGGRDGKIFDRGLFLWIEGLPGLSLGVVEFRAGIRGSAGESWLLSEASLPALCEPLEREFTGRLALDKEQIRAMHRCLLRRGMTVRAPREGRVKNNRMPVSEQRRGLIEHGLVSASAPGGSKLPR